MWYKPYEAMRLSCQNSIMQSGFNSVRCVYMIWVGYTVPPKHVIEKNDHYVNQFCDYLHLVIRYYSSRNNGICQHLT